MSRVPVQYIILIMAPSDRVSPTHPSARLLRRRRAFSRAAAVLSAGAVMAAVLLAATGPSLVAQAADTDALSPDEVRAFTEAWAKQPRVALDVTSSAPVVIVKFNDYECPTCRQMELMYRPILDAFAQSNPGQIDYVMKDWPWNAACNFNTASTLHGHEAACDAAAAARMARDRGKYREMADWLFANQGTTPAGVREAAQRLLGVTDFDAEYAKKLPEIRRDIADGGVLQIRGTPTFFINGVRFNQLIQPQYFELAIRLELQKHAGAK
jgi:protein-disulfide isomerase